MVATLIDGKKIASNLCKDIAQDVADFKKANRYAPGLAVLLVGDNPASHVYVKNKSRSCAAVGIASTVHHLPETASQEIVLSKIDEINSDNQIHGLLVQLPLPTHLDAGAIIERISPHKDVDGLHPLNLGLLLTGRSRFVPCTPLGCLHLIRSVVPSLEGKHVVVVGWSVLVGRPLGILLGFEKATVVSAHVYTKNLKEECQRADILISAVGKPGLITKEHVKPGAIVIDIGITRVPQGDGTTILKGDVNFDEVAQVASFLTPVPGGVGPMTVAYLLRNTLAAAQSAKDATRP